ncbi:ATP-binding cassette domain-containing protein [Aminiphilus circumscriptus]|uniref:ATP-binding cassette domain-containing protein n=1 Tax=Aminiphilus circumscriptus TaxID=290732 RepID=UPI0004B96886|nr:sugar ABC transporter ATP-binding protein [Aminiphilus circumscriptus]
METLLDISGLSKRYGDCEALRNVSFSLARGEIVALLGANGSGKSTLLHILSGHEVIFATGSWQGRIVLDGVPLSLRSPRDALRAGIGMVHQELSLLPGLSAAENLFLTRERTRTSLPGRLAFLDWVDRAAQREEGAAVLAELGIRAGTEVPVRRLSLPVRHLVEFARERSRGDLRLLLLDEPTSCLNRGDSDTVLDAVRTLAARGTGVLFVSHKISEAIALADRMVVLRDGEVAGIFSRRDADERTLVRAMFGGDLFAVAPHASRPDTEPGPDGCAAILPETCALKNPKHSGQRAHPEREGEEKGKGATIPAVPAGGKTAEEAPPVLAFENVTTATPDENLRNFCLAVRPGEILGVTSLLGQGKGAFSRFFSEEHMPFSGTLRLAGRTVTVRDASFRRHVAFLSEDRRRDSLLLERSVLENLTFPAYALAGRFRRMGPLGLFDRAEAERYAEEAVRRYGITCVSLNQPVRELSGGNQQKVAVAKAAGLSPTVLVVCEPTRGVDLRTKRALLEWFAELNREEGMTIVICSGEPEDLVGFCSRIAVLREGQVRRMLGRDADEAALLAAMEMDREADGDGAANGPECGGGLVGAVPGAPEARR